MFQPYYSLRKYFAAFVPGLSVFFVAAAQTGTKLAENWHTFPTQPMLVALAGAALTAGAHAFILHTVSRDPAITPIGADTPQTVAVDVEKVVSELLSHALAQSMGSTTPPAAGTAQPAQPTGVQ